MLVQFCLTQVTTYVSISVESQEVSIAVHRCHSTACFETAYILSYYASLEVIDDIWLYSLA